MLLMVRLFTEILMICLFLLDVQTKSRADMVMVMLTNVVMLMDMLLCRLHLNDQVAIVCIDVLRIEDAATGLKRTASFVPTSLVEVVEIIAPLELKLVLFAVITVSFNIVEVEVPGHIGRIKICAPCVESRRPEVHFQGLGLVHEVDSCGIIIL